MLILKKLEIEAGRRRNAAHFIKSTRTRLGLDISSELMQLRQRITKLENCLNDISL